MIWVSQPYFRQIALLIDKHLLTTTVPFTLLAPLIMFSPYVISVIIVIKYLQNKKLSTYIIPDKPTKNEIYTGMNCFSITLGIYSIFLVIVTVFNIEVADSTVYTGVTLPGLEILIINIIVSVIVVPIIEEYLFRYSLQEYLYESVSDKLSIFVPTLFFGLMHAPFTGLHLIAYQFHVLLLFSIGLVWAYAYHKTRSITIVIIIHSGYNLFILFLFFIIV